MTRETSRREFIRNTAVGSAGILAGTQLGFASTSWPIQDKIQFASIGVSGKGGSDSAHAAQNGDMVAICDVDKRKLDAAGKRWPKAKKYQDYRKMFDEMGKKINAVTISTPDHHHAIASARAIRLDIHTFCQKPLTHTLEEARVIGKLARKHGVATMMGNQGTASDELRRSAEIVRSGALGDIQESHVWTNRPVWPQGMPAPKNEHPVPDHLDWDAYCGPAPKRPFRKKTYHPFRWRGWWDFGTGALGDMACHTLNMPFMALDLTRPISVDAKSPGHNGQTYPPWSIIRYQFGETDSNPAFPMTWYDGGKLPPQELLKGKKLARSGVLLIGSKGSLYSPGDYGEKLVLTGEARGFDGGKGTIPRAPEGLNTDVRHFSEWVRAIRGGRKATANFEDYAVPLTEVVLLGNLAVWAGKKIEWDPKEQKATNAPEVEKMIRKDYRSGWELG